MRVTVFGAAGSVGSEVVTEAVRRGHQVTAVVRAATRFPELHPAATPRIGDASSVEDVVALSTDHDVVISATRPAPGHEGQLVATATALLTGLAKTGVRLLLVGGAATLAVPGSGGGTVLDDPNHLPAEHRPIALACVQQLAVCRADSTVEWAYLSPPALLLSGPRTGRYRLGTDELVVDAEGASTISTADLAVALLDEAERPAHSRTRFTVGY